MPSKWPNLSYVAALASPDRVCCLRHGAPRYVFGGLARLRIHAGSRLMRAEPASQE